MVKLADKLYNLIDLKDNPIWSKEVGSLLLKLF